MTPSVGLSPFVPYPVYVGAERLYPSGLKYPLKYAKGCLPRESWYDTNTALVSGVEEKSEFEFDNTGDSRAGVNSKNKGMRSIVDVVSDGFSGLVEKPVQPYIVLPPLGVVLVWIPPRKNANAWCPSKIVNGPRGTVPVAGYVVTLVQLESWVQFTPVPLFVIVLVLVLIVVDQAP